MNERINEIWRAADSEYEKASNEIKALLKGAFVQGAQWADQNPANPWRDASKELPEMGGLYLVHNGRTSQTIRYNKEQNRWGVNPWVIVSVKYWMPIPEIKKED